MSQSVNLQDHKIVFLFSGQGSHYRGMGRALYAKNPVFAKSLQKSDVLVQEHLGRPLIKALYETDNKTPFDDLLTTHPAIVAIELAMLAVLEDKGITPDHVLGNSLGEFAAGVACGIWTQQSALEAAIAQALAIVQSGTEGGMLALIDIDDDKLKTIINNYDLSLASKNFPGHFTVSGTTDRLDALEHELKATTIPYLRLPVTYPFHSPLLAPAKAGFSYYSYTAPPLNTPTKAFISGVYARSMQQIPDDYFWTVVSESAHFIDLIAYMEAKAPCLYLDLGPSGTSATFAKYNLSKHSTSVTQAIMTPFGREDKQLEKLCKMLKTDA